MGMMTAEQINEYVAWIKFEHGLIKVCDSDDPKAFAVYKWATVESHAAAQLAEKEREPFEKPEPGEWIQPQANDYLMRCCDCGLTHAMDFRIYEGRVQFRAYRVGNPPPPKCSFCGEFRGHKEDCWTVETVEKLQEVQAWKESQIKVTPDWQKIGELLNIGLGQSVTENIIPAITDLRERLRQREAELEQAREIVTRGVELAKIVREEIHGLGAPMFPWEIDAATLLAAIPSPPKEGA